ncbi:MAG: prenyltransferase [Deltaproteobacteria bacterium]|nr:prenyltransferase [Deltaproteobacteria bacterium]
MSALGAWIQASRPTSQSYIALPILLGQAIWVAQGGSLDLGLLVLAQLFGVFDQLYIVWANDYADQESDRLNATATLFSGGSRVLVEGRLAPAQIRRASLVAASGALLVSLILAVGWGRALALPLALAALLLLWMYSYPPVRLSYRGGGELLQMIGVGGVLPLYGYLVQAGSLDQFPWALLAVLLPTHLACAFATTLPDEPSDRASHKHTVAVFFGPAATSALITLLNAASAAAFVLVPWRPGGVPDRALAWLSLPSAASLIQLALLRSAPGSRWMTVRVGFAVLATLSLLALLTVLLLNR